MEKCSRCGNRLSDIDVLCPGCGALVENIHAKPAPVPKAAAARALEKNPAVFDAPADARRKPPASADNRGIVNGRTDAPPSFNSYADKPTPASNSYADKAASLGYQPPEHRDKILSPLHGSPARHAPAAHDTPGDGAAGGYHSRVMQPHGAAAAKPADTRAGKAAQKAWLEITELGEAPRYTAPPPQPSQPVQPPVVPDPYGADTRQRRYHSAPPAPSRPRQDGELQQKQPVRAKRPLLTIFLWLLVAAALFAAFYFLSNHVSKAYGGYPAFVRELTGGKIDLDTGEALSDSVRILVSEAQTESGAPAYQFDVSAAGGTSVRVLPLGDVYKMTSGKASFVIQSEALARALGIVTFEGTYVSDNVSLVVSAFSQETTHSVGPLTLHLTDASYTRNTPTQAYLTTTDETVTIDLIVDPAASVYINNTNYTAQIDELGRLSVTLPLDTLGENYYIVNALQVGRKTVKDSFTVRRDLPKTVLVPESTYLRVYEDTFECSGKTSAGATVTITADGNVVTAPDVSGEGYSLTCTVRDTGLHLFTLRATSSDRADNEVTIAVERLPGRNAFITGAQQLQVGEIAKRLKSLGAKAVQTTGVIENLTAAAHIQSFVLVAEGGRLNCYYHGTADLSNGGAYQMYGTANARTNSFYVMFVG